MKKNHYKDIFDFLLRRKLTTDQGHWVKKFAADLESIDCCERTALQYAAYENDAELTEILVKQGAKIDTKDEFGITPLHRAAFWNSIDVVKCLIKAGADIKALDNNDLKPLDMVLQEKVLKKQNQPGIMMFDLFDNTDFCTKTSKSKAKKFEFKDKRKTKIIIDLLTIA